MLTAHLRKHLQERFSLNIKSIRALSGGDINEVYLIEDQNKKYVAKINEAHLFPGMFKKEVSGLNALRKTGAIDVPEVLGYGDFETNTYLILDYRESGKASHKFWELFGQAMAALHQTTHETFGFKEDNYLGSLPQYNDNFETASQFYIHQRLMPQFKIAFDKGYVFENLDSFYQRVKELIPNEPPALIHGDLWSGNYLVNSQNKPCLIDPAVAYAPREMDLAMMKLFGGFDDRLFSAYDEAFQLKPDWEKRIKLWQLYYILAHLNLFGGHYYTQAKEIMSQY
jgi:fructosamine-3-kinase